MAMQRLKSNKQKNVIKCEIDNFFHVIITKKCQNVFGPKRGREREKCFKFESTSNKIQFESQVRFETGEVTTEMANKKNLRIDLLLI